MPWVFASTAVGLYCSGTNVVTIAPVSFTMSSNGLETVWYPISSLCASLNANTVAGVTLPHFLWPLKCLMPKLRTAAPQRKSLTYLSVCNDVKRKYSSCKNARVKIYSSHYWKQHFSSMCALRCEGAWSEETCMHLALIQL